MSRHSQAIAYDNYSTTNPHRDFAFKNLMDLAKNGVDFLRDSAITDSSVDNWIDYSQKIVEIATRDYDPKIYVSYLQMILSIRYSKNFNAFQRMKTCVDYLLEVLNALR